MEVEIERAKTLHVLFIQTPLMKEMDPTAIPRNPPFGLFTDILLKWNMNA